MPSHRPFLRNTFSLAPQGSRSGPTPAPAGSRPPEAGAREGRGGAWPRTRPRLRPLPGPAPKASLGIGQLGSRGALVALISRELAGVCKKCGRKRGLFPRRRGRQDEGEVARPGRTRGGGLGLPRRQWWRRCPQSRPRWPMVPGGGAGAQPRAGWEWIACGPHFLGRARLPPGCGAPGWRSRRLARKCVCG